MSQLQEYPLISIITPTWQRHDLMMRLLEVVDEQEYPNLEHIIVSEGHDPELAEKLEKATPRIKTYYFECGRNWSSELTESYCAAPVIMGQLAAHGEYQFWLADDEWADPRHIQLLFDAMLHDGTDFAYSRVLLWCSNNPQRRWEVGSDTPRHGEITNCLYKRELLDKGIYRTHVTRAGDWDLIRRWMEAGATWSFVDELTFTHRVDNCI